jgi:hypothetical protein
MRTHVTFRADRFDPYPPADAPLDSAHGRALAEWLAKALAAVPALAVTAPQRDEWGWLLWLDVGPQRLALALGPVSTPVAAWLLAVTPVVGLDGRDGGRVDQGALECGLRAVHELLVRAEGIHDLGWHEAAVFDRGVAAPAATPFSPPSWERA